MEKELVKKSSSSKKAKRLYFDLETESIDIAKKEGRGIRGATLGLSGGELKQAMNYIMNYDIDGTYSKTIRNLINSMNIPGKGNKGYYDSSKLLREMFGFSQKGDIKDT